MGGLLALLGMWATFQIVLATAGGLIVGPPTPSGREEWSWVANGLLVLGFLLGPPALCAWAWGGRPRPMVVVGVGVGLAAVLVAPAFLVGLSGGWVTTAIGSQVGWAMTTATAAVGSAVLRRKSASTAESTAR